MISTAAMVLFSLAAMLDFGAAIWLYLILRQSNSRIVDQDHLGDQTSTEVKDHPGVSSKNETAISEDCSGELNDHFSQSIDQIVKRPAVFGIILLILLALLNSLLAFRPQMAESDLVGASLSVIVSLLIFLAIPRISRHYINLLQDKAEYHHQIERFQTAFDGIPSPFALKDKKFAYLFVNPAFARLLGREPASILGRTDVDFFPRPQANQFSQEEARAIETGRPQTRDEEVNISQGKRWLRLTRSPWKDSSGNLRGVIVSANDITAFKQTETAQATQLQAQIQKTEEVLARTSRAEAALSTTQEESRIAIQKQKSNLSTYHEATLELFATDFIDKPSIDLSGPCQSILSYALKLSGFTNALVAVMEDNHLVIRAATTAWGAALGVIMRPGSDLLGKAWQSGQIVKTDNYSTWSGRDLDFYRLGSFEKSPLAAIGFPLSANAQPLGALAIFSDFSNLSDFDFELLNRFVTIASQALAITHLSRSSAQSMQETKKALASMQYRARLEHLMALISSHFINLDPEKVDYAINQALQTLGRFTCVDRVFLYFFPGPESHLTTGAFAINPSTDSSHYPQNSLLNTNGGWLREWIADGISPHVDAWRDMHWDGLNGWVRRLNRLETIHIPSLSEHSLDSDETTLMLAEQGIRSFTAVPLVSNRAVVGFIGFESLRNENHWSDDILSALKISADMFVNALEANRNILRLHQRLQQSESRRAILEHTIQQNQLSREMSELLHACRTPEEAYQIIARYMRRLIPGASGILYLIRNPNDPAEKVVAWGEAPPGPGENEIVINECWGLRRGRPYIVTDSTNNLVCGHITHPIPQNYLCAPLVAQGETVGLLHLRDNPPEIDDLSPNTLAMSATDGTIASTQGLALVVAEQISLALSNLNLRNKLRSQAIRDPLTGLFNRRYMEETLVREVRRATRHGNTVGVIMFDVDRLKQINDTLGHDAGDTLLRAVGSLLQRIFRGEDVACRYGGDEFTIILPESSLADTWQRAEQLREECKRLDLEIEGKRFSPPTLSIGVGVFPDHGSSAERILQSADAAAYQAKNEGGDRVMIGKTGEGD